MRILMVPPFFYEPPQAKIGLLRTAEMLSRKGHEISVITSKILDSKAYENFEDVQVFRIPTLYLASIPYTIPFSMPNRIVKICREYDIEILHAHAEQFITSLFAARAKKRLHLPLITSVHGMALTSGRPVIDGIARLYDMTCARYTMKNSDRVILLAEHLRARASYLGVPDHKIDVIPTGTEVENLETDEALKRELGIRDEKVVLYVGRLYPLKGINYFVKACKDVLTVHDDVKFVFVGDGPSMKKIPDDAHFIPVGYRNDVRRFYSIADVFVLPSLSEGLPTALLEAASYGLPCISTDIGGAKEILGDGSAGILVKPAS
ncbi:MAG: glycosyltransferase family 4 protein, partial [Candidatus Hydrothermarchaeaceae archaeon]